MNPRIDENPPQSAGPEPQRTSAVRPPIRSRRRAWVFRAAAVLLGLSPLLLVEAALRILGIGADLRLVVPSQTAPGWSQLNPLFDQPYYGQADLSGPEPRTFQLPKPPATRRILVVGGSTVIGFPYSSELAFPRHLEVALQARAKPGETIEVLNAGMTALNSSAEVAVVEEGLKADPDLIVVYTGHNEFYGPGGVASSSEWLNPEWYRFIARWRRLYLLQALSRITRPTRSSSDLIESLPGNVHIPLDGKLFDLAATRFEQNMTAMAELSRAAGVPIVFVSPVANEHDQPPIEDLRELHSAGDAAWQQALRTGERELKEGNPEKAVTSLEAARVGREADPLIRFRLAQAYEQTGRRELAIEQYQQALNLDGCRFRAPSVFRSRMAAVAARYTASGARFVDLHAEICRNEAASVPGRMHFLEHVHFTWDGNRAVGDALAHCITEQVWPESFSIEKPLDDVQFRSRLAVQQEDHLAALTLAMMIYQRPPFRDGADAEKLAASLAADSLTAFQQLSPARSRLFSQLTTSEMAGDLMEALVRQCRSAEYDELLGPRLRAQVIRQPWNLHAREELSDWQRRHGVP